MKTFAQYIHRQESTAAELGLDDNPDSGKLMTLVKIALDKYPKRVLAMLEELKDHDHKIRAGLEEMRMAPNRRGSASPTMDPSGDSRRDVIVPAAADANSGDFQ